MHKGRSAPILFEYWAGNQLFWPARPPRKIALSQTSIGPRGTWDILPSFPLVDISDVGVWDQPSGILRYTYVDPGGAYQWRWELLNAVSPPGNSVVRFRLDALAVGGAGDAAGEFLWNLPFADNTPAYTVGVVTGAFVNLEPTIAVYVRSATWAEV